LYKKYAANISFLTLLVHPCDKSDNGGCNHICNKRKEWKECSCEPGFALSKDKMTCKKGENKQNT